MKIHIYDIDGTLTKVKGDNQKQDSFETYAFNPERIIGIYVDDPLGNDSGLCALKPECVRLIRTVKNKDKVFAQFTALDWTIIQNKKI